MDIIVTVPKSEYENIKREDEWAAKQKEGIIQFWAMSRLPKDLQEGDKVFFIQDGAIRYYQECIGFIEEGKELQCEVTGRPWKGPALLLKFPAVDLPSPIPMRGFQGFKYKAK